MDSALDLKETKQEWIGNIPTHWDLKKIKFVFWNRNENNNPIKSENLISLTIEKGVIPHSEKTGGGNKPKDDLTKYKLVYPGDIVLNSMNVIAGAVGISKYFGVVSPVYYMLLPKDLNHSNKYFHYLFRTETFQKSLYGLGNGILIKQNEDTGKLNTIRMRIPMDKLGDQFIPVPPAEEQKLIAKYLDKKTNQIEIMIEKIQKKIELLKEQRIALIHQCTTKGLDPNVELKHSGVDWIGDIPKHWEIIPVKRLFSTYFGGSWGEEPKENQINNLVSVIRVTEFDMNTLTVSKEIPTIRSLELPNNSQKLIKNGDLILEKSGGGEKTPVGRAVVFDQNTKGQVVNSNFTNVCRPNKNIVDPYFCVFVLSSLYSSGTTFRNIKQTTGIQNLDIDSFMSEKIVIPPMDEQLEISKKLKKSNNLIQDLVNKNNHKINLLKEYRRSVVSEAVTGKVKVTK